LNTDRGDAAVADSPVFRISLWNQSFPLNASNSLLYLGANSFLVEEGDDGADGRRKVALRDATSKPTAKRLKNLF
jgi:hypothetical protein